MNIFKKNIYKKSKKPDLCGETKGKYRNTGIKLGPKV